MSRNIRRKVQRQRKRARRRQIERLEARQLLAANWQNPIVPADVSELDGQVTAFDALLIINELSKHENSDPETGKLSSSWSSGKPRFDVNGDHYVTARDALIVVNQLGSSSTESILRQPTSQPQPALIMPVGTETRVNSETDRSQTHPFVAMAATA